MFQSQAEYFYQKGRENLTNNRIEKFIENFNRAIAIRPKLVEAYENRSTHCSKKYFFIIIFFSSFFITLIICHSFCS